MPSRSAEPVLRPILPHDEGFLKALEEAGMPRDDLGAAGGVYFALVDARDVPLGYCGYEKLGAPLALIRSCVVPRARRGQGAGRAMMAAFIELLGAEGLHDLYLFTVDADPFFAKFGFKVLDRDEAPEVVRATFQFNMECCAGGPFIRRAVKSQPPSPSSLSAR